MGRGGGGGGSAGSKQGKAERKMTPRENRYMIWWPLSLTVDLKPLMACIHACQNLTLSLLWPAFMHAKTHAYPTIFDSRSGRAELPNWGWQKSKRSPRIIYCIPSCVTMLLFLLITIYAHLQRYAGEDLT